MLTDEFLDQVRQWQSDPYQTHKRAPFRAHSFDNDGRYWVVGTTNVSVLHGFHAGEELAQAIADEMNKACAAHTHLHEEKNDALTT